MEEDSMTQEQHQQQQPSHLQEEDELADDTDDTEPSNSHAEVTEGTQESVDESQIQDEETNEASSAKRESESQDDEAVPGDGDSSQSPTDVEAHSPPPPPPNHEDTSAPGSPSSSSKRRRVSMPGKSILKLTSQEEDGDLTSNQELPDEPTLGSVAGSDATETFSSTTEFLKRSRKSIPRRVSFAATARIRMFERDDKEDELPKTMSFLEGLNPNVALNTPFTFERSPFGSGNNSNNNNYNNNIDDDTMDSAVSAGTDEVSQDHSGNTQLSAESSDSEKERSFEINVYAGNSDSTGSSGAETPFHFPSSESDHGKTPFDDGDPESESSSDDEHRHYFPDRKLMKRSSGIGIYEGDRDSILGPQIDLGPENESQRLSLRSDIMDDGTQDYSMEYNFRSHRSSIGDRHPGPLLPPSDFQQESDGKEERSVADEDTDMDMDITAPIGGIQELAQELAQEMPPTAFHDAADNTAMFSDFGSMDMTQPVGGIIDDILGDVDSPHIPAALLYSDSNNNTEDFEKHLQDEHDKGTEDYLTGGSLRMDQGALPPSTPPRRASERSAGDRSPNSYPRRSLGTPGRFTPTVKARLNIFPEVLEKQLQTLESSASTEPVFRASHVSPETSSLAKRIYRYSVGAYTRISGEFQGRLLRSNDDFQNRQQDDQDDTMDMAIDKRLASVQGLSHDIFTESPALAGEYMQGTQDGEDGEPSRGAALLEDENDDANSATAPSEGRDGTLSETGDEDSFMELPPITLSKFLSLVGVSFLDHLNASTRRRTIPHRATDADGSTVTYHSSDLVKAMALSVPELHSYREACKLLKQSIDTSRAFAEDQEKKLSKKNPEYFREFRESNTDTKEFMKERFKMIKVHSKLETNAAFSIWKMDVLKVQQEALEQHLDELKKDISNLGSIRSALEKEKTSVLPRRDMIRQHVTDATERQRGYELCDKEQLASLAEAAEEQGAQIEHYESVKIKKAKELSELRARVEKLKLAEQSEKSRITVAEKTIQEHQYVRIEDLNRAKDVLSILKATHLWEPIGLESSSSSVAARTRSSSYLPSLTMMTWTAEAVAATIQAGKPLEFLYDRTIKVSIDVGKIGKEDYAVQVSEFENGESESEAQFALSLEDRQRVMAITALAPKRRKDIKEYVGLLRDYTKMIASKYKAGMAVSKILCDISLFWNKVCLIRRDVEMIRAHHVVDLVAGSAENLKELETNGTSKRSLAQQQKQAVTGSTPPPIVVLDIRVRFTGPIMSTRKSPRRKGEDGEDREDGQGMGRNGHQRKDGEPSTEPVKFYLWFTFTLNDLLSFPGSNSFTWRLEVVYGDISQDHVAQAVGPIAKKGGYEVLRETCVAVNQLLQI